MVKLFLKGSDYMAAKREAKKSVVAKATYETAEQLSAACDKYFEKVDKTGDVPSEAGLALYLGISVGRLRNWFDGNSREELQEAVQDAYGAMTVRYLQMLQSGNKNMTPFVIFMLKQVRFSGYQDKIEAKTDIAVNVKMGSGMDASDFK
jgi:hypothetical protein